MGEVDEGRRVGGPALAAGPGFGVVRWGVGTLCRDCVLAHDGKMLALRFRRGNSLAGSCGCFGARNRLIKCGMCRMDMVPRHVPDIFGRVRMKSAGNSLVLDRHRVQRSFPP